MLKTLLMGALLRCPHCQRGTISAGIFHIRATCPVCEVRFERKAGESAGASIIWISFLPVLALALFFGLYALNPDGSMLILLGAPVLLVLVVGIGFYRHARGLWIAIAYLTGDVYVDRDKTPDQYVRH